MSKTDFVIEVLTDANLGDEAFVTRFMQEWMRLPKAIHPERFDLGEPIRREIAKEGIDEVVRLWIESQQPLMFQRRKSHKFIADISWRKEKGRDPRMFPWRCTVWLNRSAPDDIAENLFKFLILTFQPAFGFLSSEDDHKRKHFVSFQSKVGTVEKFIGTDVLGTIPGIYWKTFFGKGVMDSIKERDFLDLGTRCERVHTGYLVTAYESSNLIDTEEGRSLENQVAELLGAHKFFDKSTIDPNALKLKQTEIEAIEQAVKEKKR